MSTVQVYPPPPNILSHHPPPPLLPGSFPSPVIQQADSSNASNLHVNPSVLVIVIILSVVFICSGILHLLARCLGRRRTHVPPLTSPVNSIRGQLQHLFTLHDAGVEQVFIDTLPVFLYGSIRGLKDSADCAVCLNEFAEEDRLRLLPKCKHAFHLECIDTWLLSNSTCPLCRRSLLPDAETAAGVTVDGSSQRMRPPAVVHDSSGCARAFAGSEQDENQAQQHGSFRMWGTERTASLREIVQVPEASPPQETPLTPGAPTVCVTEPDGSEKVLRVELGKVNVDSRRVSSGAGNSRRPRSYSMGSYEYIVDFSNLQLTLQPTPYPGHPQNWAPSKPTHRSALSDSIPELASAGQTPGNEDLFWASRGLDTPQNLSRAREIMSPSPGRFAFSPTLYDSQDCSPIVADEATSSHEQGFTIDYDDEENVEGEEEACALSRRKGSEGVKSIGKGNEEVEMTEIMVENGTAETALEQKRSSSLRLPEENSETLSATLGLPPAAEQKFHEVSVDVSVPSSSVEDGGKNVLASLRRSSLSWLRGRGRRLVYSAATPSPVQDIHIAGK